MFELFRRKRAASQTRKRALLIGSAPKVFEQMPRVQRTDYDLICCINNIFNEQTADLLNGHGIRPDYYFFSDYMYYEIGYRRTIDGLEAQKKIICVPPQKSVSRRELARQGIIACSRKTTKGINNLGGYTRRTWASTGMFSLGYLLWEEQVEKVDLIGFSFFEGRLHYYDDQEVDEKHHSRDAERKIFEFFHRQNRCSSI